MKALRPFFSYYGAKHHAAALYPPPRHRTVVEPFAGSAGYATRYSDRVILLNDVDPRVFGVWSFLIAATEREILALPTRFESTDELKLPQEARDFLGFHICKGSSYPRRKPSRWQSDLYLRSRYAGSIWSEETRSRIARQLRYIRHWKVSCGTFESVPDISATWFIDPPYEGKVGRHYTYRHLDRQALADWCRRRDGQTIVCEQAAATWLDFEPLARIRSMSARRGHTFEAIWLRDTDGARADFAIRQDWLLPELAR